MLVIFQFLAVFWGVAHSRDLGKTLCLERGIMCTIIILISQIRELKLGGMHGCARVSLGCSGNLNTDCLTLSQAKNLRMTWEQGLMDSFSSPDHSVLPGIQGKES